MFPHLTPCKSRGNSRTSISFLVFFLYRGIVCESLFFFFFGEKKGKEEGEGESS